MNRVAELTWPTAVGSGALLGCVIVMCLIIIGILVLAGVVTMLSMVADQIQHELDDLKQPQSNKNDSERLETVRKLNECLGLVNKYIRACDKLLCSPLRFICKLNVQSHPGATLPLAGISGRSIHVETMKKHLNLFCRSVQNKVVKLLLSAWIWPVNKCCSLFGCNHKLDVGKQPNDGIEPSAGAKSQSNPKTL